MANAIRREGYDGHNEIVSVHGLRGILVNKREIDSYSGQIPLSEYTINDDPNPRVIRKTLDEPVKGKQQVTIRYLEPPPAPQSGDIIIEQEKAIIPQPGPPIVLRELQTQSRFTEPKVIRELPPKIPQPEPRKIIKILPAKVAPPPRKIVVEKMPLIDEQTQPIVIERWLAPKRQPRRVIFQGVLNAEPVRAEPVRNEIIQYEAPKVIVSQEVKDGGVVRMDPNEYFAKYRDSLVDTNSLPQFARDVRPPAGYILASDPESRKPPPLDGDVHILSKIDLEREGLGEYRIYVNKNNPSSSTTTSNYPSSSSTAANYPSSNSNYPPSSSSTSYPNNPNNSNSGAIGNIVINSTGNNNTPPYPTSNSNFLPINRTSPTRVTWSDQSQVAAPPPAFEVRASTSLNSPTESNYYERRTTTVYKADSSM